MNFRVRLHAVIEAPFFQELRNSPWEIVKLTFFPWIRLSGELSHPEIGLVLAQLANYNHIDLRLGKKTGDRKITRGKPVGHAWGYPGDP